MTNFYTCPNCGKQYSNSYAIEYNKQLFCTYKCSVLWKAGIPTPAQKSPTERDDAKAEDEEFERITKAARKVC